MFLNEVLVKMPPDPSSDEPVFHVSHIDRVYTLKTETLSERYAHTHRCTIPGLLQPVKGVFLLIFFCRATWVQKIKAASEHFIETEKKKREKAYQGEPKLSTNTQLH